MEETLGKRIAKNRKRLGLTQDRLAELLGVTAQAVSKWENDQSCPDIGTLPRLAEIFGVTTDELLGKARTVNAVVEPRQEKEEKLVEITWGAGKKWSIGTALWLVAVGALSFYDNAVGKNLSFWTIAWTTALVIYGFFGLYPRFSVFRLGCAATGGYFLASELLGLPSLGWPVMLMVLGGLLLLQALQKPTYRVSIPDVKVNGKAASDFYMDGEHFESRCSFGEKRNLVTLSRLSSGLAQVNFGELTVDLSGCGEIADHAVLEIKAAFGELLILVPSSCRVVSSVSTAFGNFEVEGNPAPEACHTLKLQGSVGFGHGTVRYI